MSHNPVFNIDQIRNDTPGCLNVLHLNNAGSSLITKQTLKIMISHLKMEAKIGSYEAARLKADKIETIYHSIATLVNANPDEIAITNSATHAWDMAFYSIKFKPGDIILTSSNDYVSNNIAYMQISKKSGIKVKVIPNKENGDLSISALERMIDSKVKLIALTHIPSNLGITHPAEDIGRIAKEAGIIYLLDASQSIGQMPIDVKQIGCDILSASGRKYLRGPRGTGFLFVSKALIPQLPPPFLDMHAAKWTGNNYHIRLDAKRFEHWEYNIVAKLGLGSAVDYALKLDLSETFSYIQLLANNLRNLLSNIKGVTIYDKGTNLCGLINFTLKNTNPVEIRDRLMRQGVNVSSTEPTYPFGGSNTGQYPSMIRASIHYYNTPDEINRFTDIISQI